LNNELAENGEVMYQYFPTEVNPYKVRVLYNATVVEKNVSVEVPVEVPISVEVPVSVEIPISVEVINELDKEKV